MKSPIINFQKWSKKAIVLFSVLVAALNLHAQCPTPPSTCTYSVTGSSSAGYNLNANETLCIESGANFTGQLSTNANSATIYVHPGATFAPSGINNMQATLISCGITTLPSLSVATGTNIQNYGSLTFTGGLNFNGAATFYNASNSTMNFNVPSFTLGANSTLTNDGTISATEFSTTNGTTLINRDTIKTTANFNPNGITQNTGLVLADGFINVNSSANITNDCSLVSKVGFNNSSPTTVNNGLILIQGTATTDVWQNNATFTQSASGNVVGHNFFNLSMILGSGNYHFGGLTKNQGSFGDGNGINFYDATLGSPSNIVNGCTNVVFDEQGSPNCADNTTTKTAFVAPTINFNSPGCSALYAGDILPVASDDTDVYTAGTPVTVDVVSNDTTGDVVDPTTVAIVGADPVTGDLVVSGEGTWAVNPTSGAITFTPLTTFTGTPTPITYTVDDAQGNPSNAATVTLDLLPVATNDTAPYTGSTVTVPVLGNDTTGDAVVPTTVSIVTPVGATGVLTDAAGDVTSVTIPGEGTWAVNPTSGAITFTPLTTFTGTPTPITYTVDDAQGNPSNAATVTLDLLPVATNDTAPYTGSTVTVPVLGNDTTGDAVVPTTVSIVTPVGATGVLTDAAGDVTSVTIPGQGTWTVNPTTGAITFTPLSTFTGTPTPITYTVDDAQGNPSNAATVTLDLLPVATDDIDMYELDTPVTIDVLGNDTTGDAVVPTTVSIVTPVGATGVITDAAGDVTSVTIPNEGTWSVDPSTGAITFAPENGYNGDPSPISYTVEDAEGNIATAVVTLTFNVVTPIELISFNVAPSNGVQTATWVIGFEVNVQNYTLVIENQLTGEIKSTIINDAIGSSVYTQDLTLEAGKYTAYLYVNDFDGSQQLFTTAFSVEGSVTELNVYPVPTYDVINVDFINTASGTAQIAILTSLGQVIQLVDLGLLTAGSYENTLEVSNLSKGVYFVELIVDNKVVKITEFLKM